MTLTLKDFDSNPKKVTKILGGWGLGDGDDAFLENLFERFINGETLTINGERFILDNKTDSIKSSTRSTTIKGVVNIYLGEDKIDERNLNTKYYENCNEIETELFTLFTLKGVNMKRDILTIIFRVFSVLLILMEIYFILGFISLYLVVGTVSFYWGTVASGKIFPLEQKLINYMSLTRSSRTSN